MHFFSFIHFRYDCSVYLGPIFRKTVILMDLCCIHGKFGPFTLFKGHFYPCWGKKPNFQIIIFGFCAHMDSRYFESWRWRLLRILIINKSLESVGTENVSTFYFLLQNLISAQKTSHLNGKKLVKFFKTCIYIIEDMALEIFLFPYGILFLKKVSHFMYYIYTLNDDIFFKIIGF